MKNFKNKNNEYWLNKNSEDIVFQSVTGIYQLKKEDFLKSSPELTEQDYEFWKKWSDENYHQIRKGDGRYNNQREELDNFDESEQMSIKSAEDDYIDKREVEKPTYDGIINILYSMNLTPVQIHRYILKHYEGLSIKEIAKKDNVTYICVWKSLNAVEKKFCKYNVNTM